jgi:hypothetical protein
MTNIVIKSAARRFLRFLDPGADSFTFQVFDDDKERKDKSLGRTIPGTLDDCWDQLVAANENGCGVFSTVNHTVGPRRRAVDVDYVRYHFIEVDGTSTLAEILAGRFKPSWINESSPGKYHVYFNIANDVTNDVAGFKPRQIQLAALYNSGRERVDPSSVLRLPGFFHQKDPSNPFLVRMVYNDKDAPAYSIADLAAVLGEIAVATTAPAERDEEPAAPEDDAAIAYVTEFFKTEATPAISNTPNDVDGKQGNDTTYAMMCVARDNGVDRETCFDLALTYYNVRCDPLWSYEELQAIVNNAYEYGQNTQGKDSAAAEFPVDDETLIKPTISAEITAQIAQRKRDKASGIRAPQKIKRTKVIHRSTNLSQSVFSGIMAIRADAAHDRIFQRGPDLVRLNQASTKRDLEGEKPTDIRRKRGALMIVGVVPDYMMLRLDQAAEFYTKKSGGRPKKDAAETAEKETT